MNPKIKKPMNVCLVIILGISIARLYILHLRRTSIAFNFMFPPEDIYRPLAESPFSTSSEGDLYECVFVAKYPGNHAVKIYVENPVGLSKSYDEVFTVDLTIENMDGSVLLSDQGAPPFMPFRGIDSSGLYLFLFKSPDNVPLGTKMKAIVKLAAKDVAFEKKHGPLTLRVMKMSDE